MMSDVDRESLNSAANSLNAPAQIDTVICDIADYVSVVDASIAVMLRFGEVDLLFNNAVVSLAGQNTSTEVGDWHSIVDINVMGLVHVTEVFLPLLRPNDQGGYIVNTASMAGHFTSAYISPYNALRLAVVEYSENLRQELVGSNIGISVLCPTWFKSNIPNTQSGAASALQSDSELTDSPVYQMFKQFIDNGMSAENFASLALSSIAAEKFYVF